MERWKLAQLPADLEARQWQLVPDETVVNRHAGSASYTASYQRPRDPDADTTGPTRYHEGAPVLQVTVTDDLAGSWDAVYAKALAEMRAIDAARTDAPSAPSDRTSPESRTASRADPSEAPV